MWSIVNTVLRGAEDIWAGQYLCIVVTHVRADDPSWPRLGMGSQHEDHVKSAHSPLEEINKL